MLLIVLHANHGFRCLFKIAMGTDAGTPFNLHGQNARELILMVEHGLSPGEAIKSATSTAAQLLNMNESIGTVAVGRRADFVVVNGDPLQDISLLGDSAKIHSVYFAGRQVRQ